MIGELDLAVTRFIDAPRETVWQVWTERKEAWFCPKPWTAKVIEEDMRPGGRSCLEMFGPNGEQSGPLEGVFLEVVPLERIVTTDAFSAGWVPQKPFMTAVTTFEVEGNGTRYTATARHWDADAKAQHEAMGFADGWGKVADQLAEICEALAARA